MAAEEEQTSIGDALAAGVDALDEQSFEQFKSDAALGSPSWCQQMKAAERDALAELTAADTMEMQLASLRRQETPGHRASHGGLLGSVRRGNLFDSPVANSAAPNLRSRPTPESPVGTDSTRSPTAETLRRQGGSADGLGPEGDGDAHDERVDETFTDWIGDEEMPEGIDDALTD